MAKAEIIALQKRLNRFSKIYLRGIGPIMVDGKMGPSTRGRIRTIKYYLGYLGRANSRVDLAFRQRLWHPKNPRYSSPARIARSLVRRSRQRREARKNHRSARRTTGVGRYDGVPVANVAIPILEWCRDHGWRGRLVSGWRDPKYSQSLCYRICGRPSCPGLCAGLSSNHVGASPARFAVDVTDYARFRYLVAKCPIGPRIFNALPYDPVHFSPSGR